MTSKQEVTHIDDAPVGADEKLQVDRSKVGVSGTVQLTAGTVVYIPTPTADPRDPLNMSTWQKIVILFCTSFVLIIGLSMISGFGGLLGFYIPNYAAAGHDQKEISFLLSLPNLTMGIGNLIAMPVAIAVGRRCVLLFTSASMCAMIALCAAAGTSGDHYTWHLWGRMLVGVAAGQSEALVPMITQEIFFLHERARYITVQQAVQNIACAVLVIFASPIAGAVGTRWWYGIGCVMCGVCFVLAFFFVPETKYYRPQSAYQENTAHGDADSQAAGHNLRTERPELDYETFEPRTLRSNLRLVVGKPEWHKAWIVFRDAWIMLLFPNVMWAVLVNGVTLGINICIAMSYGRIVESPPYNWSHSSTSYANAGQIATSFVALPAFGWFSDWCIQYVAKRRGGIHEPEVRLLPLVLPLVVGIFTAVLYGQGAAYPDRYHWFLYIWCIAAGFFTFIGAIIAGTTYLLDSYPQRASSLLIVLCTFRSVVSFGITYELWPMVDSVGYDGLFGIFGGVTAFMGVLSILVFIWGKKIRQYTGRWVLMDD